MKCILLLGFLALSSSTPLGWDAVTGGWYGTGIASSPAEGASLQVGQQIEEALGQNVVENQVSGIPTSIGNQGRQSAAAQHVAQEVVHQALLARQGQTTEGIEELKKQLQQQFGIFGTGLQPVNQQLKQLSTVEAINQMQQYLQIQKTFAPLIQTGSSLAQTLEAVIQAQMVSDSVDVQQLGWSGHTSQTPEQSSQVFQAKIQQLIDQSNIQEIQAEIARQQARAQQLQQQQQLINQQKQQIQVQQAIVGLSGSAPVVQLQQTQQKLHLHEQQLIKQQLARQLIIQQLQQALVEQQQQLQQDIVSEQVAQSWAKRQHPWPQDLQETIGAQWPQYGYPRRYESTWNLLGSSWNQSRSPWYKIRDSYRQARYIPYSVENSRLQGVWSN